MPFFMSQPGGHKPTLNRKRPEIYQLSVLSPCQKQVVYQLPIVLADQAGHTLQLANGTARKKKIQMKVLAECFVNYRNHYFPLNR